MAESIISTNGLTVGYGRQPVLENITLSIGKGAFAGLLGANGSGKTTLLKTIAGIIPPLAGKITFAPSDAITGYVPQRESLDSAFMLSSLEVVQMGLCGRIGPGKFLRAADRKFALECMRRTGTDNLARRPFALLSGGQKQRVLIARALTAKPDLLLLDEPTAGVDPEATEAISLLLRDLNESGMTIIMVNHELPVVRKITGQILWVRHGKITQGETGKVLSSDVLERMSLQLE